MQQTIEELKLGTYDNIATVCELNYCFFSFTAECSFVSLLQFFLFMCLTLQLSLW